MESSACTSGADSDQNSPTDTEDIAVGEFDTLYQRILENAGSSIKGRPEQVERYNKRITELENTVACLKKTIEEKDAELSRAACNAAQLASAREEDDNQKRNLMAENTSLRGQIQRLAEDIEIQKAEYDDLFEKCRGREREVVESCAAESKLHHRIRELEYDLSSAQVDLNEKNNLLKQYTRDVTSLNAELCEQKKKCGKITHDLMQTSSELQKANDYIAELRAHSCPPKPQSAPSRGSWNKSQPIPVSDCSSRQKNPDCAMNQNCGCGDSEVAVLREKIKNQKDLQVALAGEVAEKHDAIISLKEQITDLDNKLRQTEIQAHFRDDIIRELRKEVKLGRAKESLAEMLGLKEGPRVQMKSRIDRLSSELEEKRSEIARLNDLIDNSSLMNLENQVKTLTLDLEARDKKMLAMCDKLDYIRSYVNQLKCEEQLSIKCGLEALLTELNDDAEKNREVRRNVSISLDREPNDGVIIINHRSHSLPDAALQRQVQNFKDSKFNPQTYLHGAHRSVKFDFEDISRLKQLGPNLENSQMNLSRGWNNIRKFNTDVHRACLQELDSIIECMNADRESLLSICTNFGNVTDRLLSVDQDSRPDEFQFLTVQNCLKSILEKFDSNFDCHSSDEKLLKAKAKIFHHLESNILIALSQLEKVKNHCFHERKLIQSIDLNGLQRHQQQLVIIAKNKTHYIKQLSSVKSDEESFFDFLSEFESNFLQHQTTSNIVKSELEILATQMEKNKEFPSESFVSRCTSTDDLQLCDSIEKSFEPVQVLENVLKQVDSSKLLEIMDHDAQMSELFSPSAPLTLQPSDSSFGHDGVQSDTQRSPAGLEGRGIHLQQIATVLCNEVTQFLEQVMQQDEKIFDYGKSSFALHQALELTQNEMYEFSKNAETSEREMVEALWLKKKQSISALQAALLKNIAALIIDAKKFQKDNELILNSFASQLQSYKEKVLEFEDNAKEFEKLKALLAEKESELAILAEKLRVQQNDIAVLNYQLVQQAEENYNMKTDYQRSMEELQAKVIKLQSMQYEEKAPSDSSRIGCWNSLIKRLF
ncbi:Hypothetical protein NTJ_01669 [Nesidiocoris tenuis]|uniref:Uncharacterized protein n=1 Tax=Nesidiocoris tenuis TaxID=355587 RepID=A0ABN7AC85_9HEMI|nr:Hypothetical protein NTJ_01669 [Nesidiocoris tenuis]